MHVHNPWIEHGQGLLWTEMVQCVPQIAHAVQLLKADLGLTCDRARTQEGHLQEAQDVHHEVLNVVRQLLLIL